MTRHAAGRGTARRPGRPAARPARPPAAAGGELAGAARIAPSGGCIA
ncbi:hypothetical protein L575_1328 [Bordetella pertussis STO1-SEAT-0007]|nr:hypothetical protein L575_1328 [Bordetella pertussis STO1-SEAT-0007]